MLVSLKEILKNELFKDVKILAGENGISRNVKRVSVFDCPCNETLIERNILLEGDVFITSLEQFRYEPDKIYEYIDTLIVTRSAGLLVITADMRHVLVDEVLNICNANAFPVVLVPEDIPYATIINMVNKYITIDNMNALNMLKLEKLMYGNITSREKMEVLYSINPNIKKYLRIIGVDGDFNSDIAQMEIHAYYLNQKNDVYVRNKHRMLIILSDDDEKMLRHHSDTTTVRLKEFIDNPAIGYSRIYNRKDISKALEEGTRALETAKTMNMESQIYDPLSVLQLLLSVRDSQEAYDFYKAYVNAIAQNVSTDSLKEFLLTMEAFVANSGNYVETARVMNQHENTIRYRVNKVKSALGMVDDNIKFNETIAVAVKLRTLINEEIK